MIQQIQQSILQMKEEKNIFLLAHSYQNKDITEIADFVGDSFQMSLAAQQADADTILVAGVRFMAETAKILAPNKTVILVTPDAGCPMAEQIEPSMIEAIKAQHPEYKVVAYINTTAALKAVCDVCVTSSTAVKIVKALEETEILFIPDCNLGAYVQKQVPEKNLKLLQGCCPIHASVDMMEVETALDKHPKAQLLVHPECTPEVLQYADYIGSTSGILEYAKQSSHKEFVIGTEISIAEHLQYACPDKKFYLLSKKLICPNMKLTTLMDVYNVTRGEGGEEIILTPEEIAKARICIDEMIRLGK